ncbi:MAG: hypothetical protein K2Q09_09910 [Phycisphaerales bacterium]|nr:hypothetical protein [Phycisphaerales bacterium]
MVSRFVVLVDRPECGVLAGDLITLAPERPTRITRSVAGGADLIARLLDAGAAQGMEEFLAIQETKPRLRLVKG